MLHFARQRNFFQAARKDAAARTDQRLVVIIPAGTGQGEHALTFRERRRHVQGLRIQENMAVIECRQQPYMFRQQHAVAENVARHVAHADDGEIFGLDVAPQLAEMPLYGFPGAARRDAHFLVVIAMAAAAGESIAQPEAAFFGNAVGDVGKSGGAFVGGDHQIGIIAVMAAHIRRRHDAAVRLQIVGDIQQRIDQHPVSRHAGCHRLFARLSGCRDLGIEAALGAHRHDHGILDLLRLDQPQYLGAEILTPVRPADAATRHFAEA